MSSLSLNSMEQNFIPWEQAQEMRDLGFKEPCMATIDQTQYVHLKGTRQPPRGSMVYDPVDCPTWIEAFEWFEKTYGMYLSKHITCTTNEVLDIRYFVQSINGTREVKFHRLYEEFDSHKSKVICLQKLITIVKTYGAKKA